MAYTYVAPAPVVEGVHRGHTMFVGPAGISVNCPALGLYGYADVGPLKAAMSRKINARAKARVAATAAREARS